MILCYSLSGGQMEKIGVIGLGKLGLPLAAVMAQAGYEVFGVDKNLSLINQLQKHEFNYDEPDLNDILNNHKDKIKFGTDYTLLIDANIVYLILPTPSDFSGQFDDSHIISAINNLLKIWRDRSHSKVIVVVSTLMPQTCERKIQPLLSSDLNNFKITLLYSPEFIALGSVIYNLKNPDMVLIGAGSPTDADLHLSIQKAIIGEHQYKVLSLTEAEIVKLLVNCYVTMKISFANFIGEIGDILGPGVDIFAISNALGMDSRIGSKYIKPGLGFGGPCFPRDNKALIAWSNEIGLSANLAQSTIDINNRQPVYMAERVYRAFKEYRRIGILGYTYKINSSVTEESQRVLLANILSQKGFDVYVYDPFVDKAQEFSARVKVCSSVSNLLDCDVIVTSKEYELYFDFRFQGQYFYI
jgi:UDPglucose 6-dehydrogenase